MVFAAESATTYLSMILGSGAFLAALGAWFKAPAEKDAAKRSIGVDEAKEIRETLSTTLDQVQEERDGARAEARTLRKEVQECHGQCDQVIAENSELKQTNRELQQKLDRALARIERLDRRVDELTAQLEAL